MNRLLSPLPINIKTTIALLRIIIGAMMMYHGWEVFNPTQIKEYAQWDMFKNSSSPLLMPYIGKSAELLSGILLFFGLFTKIGALILILTMSYVSFKVGKGVIWYGDQHPFMFVLFGILFFFVGPGKWSIDRLIFKPKSKYTSYK